MCFLAHDFGCASFLFMREIYMTCKSIRTCDIVRHLPAWAKVVKTVNDTPIYNMNVFENIMSWNVTAQ